ncbi:unnamed protein product [Hymenolepis diminuta]|uniref:Uncharacterized protein n=1 Tax=Hymenolepis diminuta TaxID=6216 RepID=A0A3P6Z9R7_HYMDI|nr:unnamed protein product [Hymenolepis diminuta]
MAHVPISTSQLRPPISLRVKPPQPAPPTIPPRISSLHKAATVKKIQMQ